MIPQSYIQERKNMVELQLKRRNITDKAILEAFGKVPRHEFMPEKHRNAAYTDNPIPIGYNQTISQPYVVAHMIQELEVRPADVALDVGTGSGYSAAILSHLCKQVYGIERIGPLAKRAARTLTRLGYDNVEIRCGDGFEGWPEKAPFDVIMLGAAPAEIPEPLQEQMADDGRLVAPIGELEQQLIKLRRSGHEFEMDRGTLVRFVPMKRGTYQEEEESGS